MTKEEKIRSKELRITSINELIKQVALGNFIIMTGRDASVPCEYYDKGEVSRIVLDGLEEAIEKVQAETI